MKKITSSRRTTGGDLQASTRDFGNNPNKEEEENGAGGEGLAYSIDEKIVTFRVCSCDRDVLGESERVNPWLPRSRNTPWMSLFYGVVVSRGMLKGTAQEGDDFSIAEDLGVQILFILQYTLRQVFPGGG